jgi:hypothetical protein
MANVHVFFSNMDKMLWTIKGNVIAHSIKLTQLAKLESKFSGM